MERCSNIQQKRRMIWFGCSHTFGHSLPDCPRVVYERGEQPSKYAFPQLVSDAVGRECVNLSWPGSSNKYARFKALQVDYQPGDIVVFVWTFLERSMILLKNGEAKHVGFWGIGDIQKRWHTNTLWSKYISCSNDKDLRTDQLYIMDHTHRVLLEKPNIDKIYHYTVDSGVYGWANPSWVKFNFSGHLNIFIDRMNEQNIEVDKASDNAHWGVNTHKFFAEQILHDNNFKGEYNV